MSVNIEDVRKARDKGVVLKTKVLSIRSGYPDSPIIIFEGKTDVGPYEVWIRKIDDSIAYIPIVASGKAQSLELYSMIDSGRYEEKLIYFIVDRDFDELRGLPLSKIIFKTCMYSLENYLISSGALRSILNDEFESSEELTDLVKIEGHYIGLLGDVCSILEPINKRLLWSKIHNVTGSSKEEKIQKYIKVELMSVSKNYSDGDINILIPLNRQPTVDELSELEGEFLNFDPSKRYRGKYLYDFFVDWLVLLSEDRKSGGRLFQKQKNIKFSRSTITHRSLASRVSFPPDLKFFVENIRSDLSLRH